MRVAKMEAIPVTYPEPNDFDATRYLCLVKITADDGQVGWGESITQFPEANFAVEAIIDGLAEFVVGKDPVHTEALWRRHKQQAWWYGYRGGIASYAIAAIDIALWDLKGKALGRSVLDLLGGPVHDRLPAIASCHAHFESIPEMVEEAQGWVADGLHGVKIGFGKRGNARLGYEHDRDVAYVKAMREGLGPDKQLMIDIGIAIKWDVATPCVASRRSRSTTSAGSRSRSAPGTPRATPICAPRRQTLIAYGEREWTLEGFERVLATGTCRRRRRRPGPRRGHHRVQEGGRTLRGLSPAGQRPRLVVGDRHRRQPGDLVLIAGVQAVRGQAAAQPDAARSRHRAVRSRRRLGLPADRQARPRHRGHRRGDRSLPGTASSLTTIGGRAVRLTRASR